MNKSILAVGLILLGISGLIYMVFPDLQNITLYESQVGNEYSALVLPLGIVLPLAGMFLAAIGLITGGKKRR